MHVFDKIVSVCKSRFVSSGSKIVLPSRLLPIDSMFFQPLKGANALDDNTNIAFIDSGSGEILASPGLHVSLLRVATILMRGREVKSRIVEDLFVTIQATSEDGFIATSYDKEGEKLSAWNFSAKNSSLALSGRRVTPVAILGVVRKLVELSLCKSACELVGAGGLVVRDGDLSVHHSFVKKVLDEVKVKAKEFNASVVGLAKTSSLLTDSGRSALAVLFELGPSNPWFYDCDSSISFVKLHKRSKYVFRLDVLGANSGKCASLLLMSSVDPSFLGYPYGLLAADKFAQVPLSEAAQLRAHFELRSKEIFGAENRASNAHSILDAL